MSVDAIEKEQSFMYYVFVVKSITIETQIFTAMTSQGWRSPPGIVTITQMQPAFHNKGYPMLDSYLSNYTSLA